MFKPSDFKRGYKVVLSGKNQEARENLIEKGNTWKVIEAHANSLCLSVMGGVKWVNIINDVNYSIEEVLVPDVDIKPTVISSR